MNIIFIGCVKFSYICLKTIIENNYNISAVCTLKESDFNTDFLDLSEISKLHNIPVKYAPNINDESSIEWIRGFKPDIIFCFGWSQILKKEILEIPKYGIIGYHPANLPKNRGRHPIVWSLVLGLKETASTFFFMDESADGGDILDQKLVLINYRDNAKTLYKKLTETAIKQINYFLPKLIDKSYKRIPQDNNLASYWRKRSKVDGIIDWRMNADNIRNLIRALTKPYCGASFFYKNTEYFVWDAETIICDLENIEPGKIISLNPKECTVKCGNNAIKIVDVEPSIFPKASLGDYL